MPQSLWECNRRNVGPRHFVSGFLFFTIAGAAAASFLANLIVTNGDPLELTTDVKYLFIRGQLTSTNSRHQMLYEKYSKRPKAQ